MPLQRLTLSSLLRHGTPNIRSCGFRRKLLIFGVVSNSPSLTTSSNRVWTGVLFFRASVFTHLNWLSPAWVQRSLDAVLSERCNPRTRKRLLNWRHRSLSTTTHPSRGSQLSWLQSLLIQITSFLPRAEQKPLNWWSQSTPMASLLLSRWERRSRDRATTMWLLSLLDQLEILDLKFWILSYAIQK